LSIYFVSFSVSPSADNPEPVAGAYVNCWIQADGPSAANEQAVSYVQDEGWIIQSVKEEAFLVDGIGKESDYFEQAKSEGEVYIFHTWLEPERAEVH